MMSRHWMPRPQVQPEMRLTDHILGVWNPMPHQLYVFCLGLRSPVSRWIRITSRRPMSSSHNEIRSISICFRKSVHASSPPLPWLPAYAA